MKALPLKGIPALYATQAFHKLLLGLKMLPAYFHESYPDFFERMDGMTPRDQETYIREALVFVRLEQEEILDLVQFCADANGIPYGKENISRLPPTDLHEIMACVALEIAREHRVRMISEDEKKNLKILA